MRKQVEGTKLTESESGKLSRVRERCKRSDTDWVETPQTVRIAFAESETRHLSLERERCERSDADWVETPQTC